MANYATFTDQELFALLKEGNERAFTEIYRRYWGVLLVHSRKMLEDEEAAKDVVQDVYMDLLNKAPQLEITTSLKAYLYSAVRYRTLDAMRKTAVRDDYFRSLVNFSEEFAPAADEQFRYNQLVKNVEASIDQLPARMRQIFIKNRIDGQSPKEISKELNISVQAVHKSIAKAVETLGSKLFSVLLAVIALLLERFR